MGAKFRFLWNIGICLGVRQFENFEFSASQDALEVMRVTHSLSHSLIVSIDFTDMTLVSDDTYRDFTDVILITLMTLMKVI